MTNLKEVSELTFYIPEVEPFTYLAVVCDVNTYFYPSLAEVEAYAQLEADGPKVVPVAIANGFTHDILTDEGSCITGSMGLLPSASTGESTPVFEPIHGSWPQAAGQNIANPLAQILSVAMMFEYFGLAEEGALVRRAVDASLDQNVRTPEIQVAGGAEYGTKEVGEWIVRFIDQA